MITFKTNNVSILSVSIGLYHFHLSSNYRDEVIEQNLFCYWSRWLLTWAACTLVDESAQQWFMMHMADKL